MVLYDKERGILVYQHTNGVCDIPYHCWSYFYKYGGIASAILFGIVAFCNYGSCNFKYEDWIGSSHCCFRYQL